MTRRGCIAATAAFALQGCAGFQTMLGGDALESSNFLTLFEVFMVVCAVMYVLVVGALLIGMWRARRSAEPLTVETGKHNETRPALRPALIAWTALIAVGLVALTIASFFTDRSNASVARDPQLTINITANQWWWDVEYTTNDVSKMVRTANEIHLPVGVPAEITLQSPDVIHSLWIPNLAGKQDLIPGRVTDMQILPRKTGTYRGQCAEFCGVQHAHMALDVTVESKADFDRWYAAQLKPAFAPVTPLEFAGYRYMVTRECGACHNITGTPASGTVAPDLTHFASRRSIAAGTLPMSTGNLYGWVADPQSQKPGNHMPTIGLEPNDLHAVIAYLETLK
ncbi:MAG TPA: cytochrome c oxidase subunit II [Paracoccaceae bacterium]|nr:cytochrome c oxidase subunit II [Paracoccaceae bacterium]